MIILYILSAVYVGLCASGWVIFLIDTLKEHYRKTRFGGFFIAKNSL